MFRTGQDWAPQVINRPPPKDTRSTAQKANAVLQSGGSVQAEAKFGAGGNTQKSATCYARKLAEDTESLKHKTVPTHVKTAIAKGRTAKGWKQSDLAQAINEKASVVNEYESGKAIPNQQVLGKMEKALGIKLRGKDIGTPLEPRGAKKEDRPASAASTKGKK